MKPYYIQRGKFEIRAYKKGLDGLINLDYMGSTEFEAGEFRPFASLRRMRENKDQYATTMGIDVDGVLFSVIHKRNQSGFKDIISGLRDRKFKLQEGSRVTEFFEAKTADSASTNFWWDTQNDFMFWPDELASPRTVQSAVFPD